jgi:hypothetical protein
MAALFIYGLVRFPDAPIHASANGQYQGKQRQAHTYSEYRAFKTWETCFFITWPIGMVALALLQRYEKKQA